MILPALNKNYSIIVGNMENNKPVKSNLNGKKRKRYSMNTYYIPCHKSAYERGGEVWREDVV